ncbi:lipopolysaccharide transport periplasmic protein LptA [Solimonas sp. SE-A11]|uniref:lipopolysaccharide transport periplasmic protein LptA n=1 Tax=Solimonas sp. SE-A11 TaxID=3054954 RepID=UPI00259CF7E9|nr:lipopolysaccharide transport periplasmic protein LptA [Solimonas sp. SE-A11]MDM4770633.1 lipopolysaccharide transport periplasmic protein LptA [Solimonas sp. SE-A11]
MSRNRAAEAALLLVLGLVTGLAAAQQKRENNVDALRPNGPVTVTADRAEWEQNGAMVYTGNVQLSSDTLTLRGDRLELRQLEGGQFTASVTGKPAHLAHPGLKEKNGEAGPPVSAEARTLNYDSRTSMVDILGNAHLTRGKDQIDGDNIGYDAAARRIRAAGGEGGQVKIVIQPPPKSGTGGSRAAPKAPPPPAMDEGVQP